MHGSYRTRMAGDEQETKMMLDSRQLLQARNYNVEIVVGAKRVWATAMVILNTDAGPNLNGEKFIMIIWALLK